jgi:hypothetical protein
MSLFEISKPGRTPGFNKEEHVSHVIVFVDPKAEEALGFDGEGTQPAARCGYVACVNCGLVLSDFVFFANAIVPKIVAAGEIVAGQLVRGTARGDRSAPYLLADPSNDDLRTVEAFLEERATRMPSGKIVIESQPAGRDDAGAAF